MTFACIGGLHPSFYRHRREPEKYGPPAPWVPGPTSLGALSYKELTDNWTDIIRLGCWSIFATSKADRNMFIAGELKDLNYANETIFNCSVKLEIEPYEHNGYINPYILKWLKVDGGELLEGILRHLAIAFSYTLVADGNCRCFGSKTAIANLMKRNNLKLDAVDSTTMTPIQTDISMAGLGMRAFDFYPKNKRLARESKTLLFLYRKTNKLT